MTFRLGWLNQPYLIIIVALSGLAVAIAGTKSDDDESSNLRDGLVIHADRPDPLTDFLIGHGWEDPPAPGDLSPTLGQEGQGIPAAPEAPR
jgi:hypothetical protein